MHRCKLGQLCYIIDKAFVQLVVQLAIKLQISSLNQYLVTFEFFDLAKVTEACVWCCLVLQGVAWC